MPRTKDPAIQERNQKVVEAHLANPERSYSDLAREFGMSDRMVYLVLRDQRSGTPRSRRRYLSDAAPLSNMHAALGALIDAGLKARILDRDNDIPSVKASQLAARLRISSPQRLEGIRCGSADVTLSELMKIAQWTKTGIVNLVDCRRDEARDAD